MGAQAEMWESTTWASIEWICRMSLLLLSLTFQTFRWIGLMDCLQPVKIGDWWPNGGEGVGDFLISATARRYLRVVARNNTAVRILIISMSIHVR